MTDLIVFLLAQLALDEAAAKAAHLRFPGPWDQAEAAGSTLPAAVSLYDAGDESIGVIRGSYVARHIARHDPARVLRDVEADRKLIAAYEDVTEFSDPWIGLDLAVRIRAERFSGHPDYREEWRP